VRYRLGVFAKGAEAAAAEGHFVHVYVSRQDRRPAVILDAWRESLERLRL
jgi:acyl-CoA thioester hydrolase